MGRVLEAVYVTAGVDIDSEQLAGANSNVRPVRTRDLVELDN